jgi:hypothetical protein
MRPQIESSSGLSYTLKILLENILHAVFSYNFLALLWRERIEVRVVRRDFALTLALSRTRERESYLGPKIYF